MLNDHHFSELSALLTVSRETFEKLSIYKSLLEKWNKSINLVGKSTIDSSWERHFLDSVQLWPVADVFDSWVDLGSGAGFPGLVLAIIASELRPNAIFHLVESDARKCAFLRNVSRETSVSVQVHNCRIEDLPDIQFDYLSARALAPLTKLLDYAEKIVKPQGKCLFLKGMNCDRELAEAESAWDFTVEKTPSITQENSSILRIGDIKRAKPA